MRPPIRAALTLALALLPVACGGGQHDDGGQDVAGVPAEKKMASEKAPVDPAAAMTDDDAAVKALDAFAATQNIGPVKAAGGQWRTNLGKPPQATFDPDAKYFWNLQTSEGPIKMQLMPKVAPMHVSSTIYLTRLGFYDGLSFHRVIPGFMAQGGCPLGNGMGGPGYKYAGEFDPDVRHDRPGLLSMANAGPGTDGSQFFLTFVPTPNLNGKHTIFGEVVEGMDVLKKLEAQGSPNQSGKTLKPLSIEKATISVEKS